MAGRNHKGELQEYCQKRGLPIPIYEHILCSQLNFNQYQSILTIPGVYDRDKKGPSALKRITSNIASNKKAADQSAADRMMTYLNVPRAATLVYPAFKQDSIQQSQHHPLHGGVPTPSHYEPPPDTTTTQSMQLVKIEKDVETGHAKVSVLPLKQEQHHVPGNMDENHSSPDYHGHGHGDYNGYGGVDNYNNSSSTSNGYTSTAWNGYTPATSSTVLADSTNRPLVSPESKSEIDHPRVEASGVKYVVMIDGETLPNIVSEVIPDGDQQICLYFNKLHVKAKTNFGENISHSLSPSTRKGGCEIFMAMDAMNMPLKYPNLQELHIYSRNNSISALCDNFKYYYPSIKVMHEAYYDVPKRHIKKNNSS